MTDPELADRTYVEPLSRRLCRRGHPQGAPRCAALDCRRPDGLNLAVELAEAGVLDKYGVELIGAKVESIKKAEDRLLFKDAMRKIGLETPLFAAREQRGRRHRVCRRRTAIPSFCGPASRWAGPAAASPTTAKNSKRSSSADSSFRPFMRCLIEESVLGWKEYELEVMRDLADNAIIVCSIENFDAMGVHTGDSITVAPAQTLTDREYQMMRDGALRCLREIGVEPADRMCSSRSIRRTAAWWSSR